MTIIQENAKLLSTYDMHLNNINYKKDNKGQLLAVNKKTGTLVFLDASLFTKWNFIKKFFRSGPLSDYRVSLDSIRKCVKEIDGNEINSLPENLKSNLLDNISYIFDNHHNPRYQKDIVNFEATAPTIKFNMKINQTTTSKASKLTQPISEEISKNLTIFIGGYGIKKKSQEGRELIQSEICQSIHDELARKIGSVSTMWTGQQVVNKIDALYDQIKQAIEINYETKEVTLNNFQLNLSIDNQKNFEFSNQG